MSNLFVDNFGKRDQSAKITADTLLQGTAKAWLNLNGTGTIATRDSFNVSSVTDIGVGIYDTNFAVAMTSVNYGTQFNAESGVVATIFAQGTNSAPPTTSKVRGLSFLSSFADALYYTLSVNADPV